jgi:hypothetical protein
MNTLENILQEKVNAFVQKSQIDANKVYDTLVNRRIDDWIIPSQHMNFHNDSSGIRLTVKENSHFHDWGLTGYSVYQIAQMLGLPPGWVKESYLSGEGYQKEAVTYALNQYVENKKKNDDRFLIRNVNGNVRGFLSTAYKRMNTQELFLTFLQAAMKMGLPITGAVEGDSKDFLEVLDPRLIYVETPKNGVVAYARGAQLRNSDFGAGKLELRTYSKHAVCLNGAIGQSYLKEIHLGSRLGQEIVYSIETINKETEVRSLQIRDIFNHIFSDRTRNFEEAQIVEASGAEVNLTQEIERLPSLGLYKVEAKAVEGVLLEHKEEDGIIGSPSKWLMGQAVSAIAREAEPVRRRELETIAGGYIYTRNPEEMALINFEN